MRSRINELYFLAEETTHINNHVPLSVEEIWMEHKWNYPNNLYIEEIEEGYQLVMRLSEELFKDYGNTWIMMIGEEEVIPSIQGITHFSHKPSSFRYHLS